MKRVRQMLMAFLRCRAITRGGEVCSFRSKTEGLCGVHLRQWRAHPLNDRRHPEKKNVTTSILSPFASNLSRADLQTLKDFALEAPFEWRRTFEELIDLAETLAGYEVDDVTEMATETEKLKTELEELKDEIKDEREAIAPLRTSGLLLVKQVGVLLRTLQKELGNLGKLDPKRLKETIDGFDDDLQEVVDQFDLALEAVATDDRELEAQNREKLDKTFEAWWEKRG